MTTTDGQEDHAGDNHASTATAADADADRTDAAAVVGDMSEGDANAVRVALSDEPPQQQQQHEQEPHHTPGTGLPPAAADSETNSGSPTASAVPTDAVAIDTVADTEAGAVVEDAAATTALARRGLMPDGVISPQMQAIAFLSSSGSGDDGTGPHTVLELEHLGGELDDPDAAAAADLATAAAAAVAELRQHEGVAYEVCRIPLQFERAPKFVEDSVVPDELGGVLPNVDYAERMRLLNAELEREGAAGAARGDIGPMLRTLAMVGSLVCCTVMLIMVPTTLGSDKLVYTLSVCAVLICVIIGLSTTAMMYPSPYARPIQVVFDHTQRWTALDEPRRLRWVSERNEKLLGRYTLRRTVLSLNIVVERVREGVAQFAAEAAGMAPGTAVAAAAAVEAARRLGPDIDALPAYVHVDSGDSESPPRLEGSEAPPEAPAVAPAVAASGVPGGAHNDQAAPPAYG